MAEGFPLSYLSGNTTVFPPLALYVCLLTESFTSLHLFLILLLIIIAITIICKTTGLQKMCSQTPFFFISRLFINHVEFNQENCFGLVKAQAPQSHFLKCFDLSNQSARDTSPLLLPVSPQFLIKARLLAGCPWSARNSCSTLINESNIQRLNSLTLSPTEHGFKGHHQHSLTLCKLFIVQISV